jgi:hypothetical protein
MLQSQMSHFTITVDVSSTMNICHDTDEYTGGLAPPLAVATWPTIFLS